jgi:glutamyl-tRNA synthetase
MSTIITRFAPSPTGYLHAGNARLALMNYLFARRHDGRFLLRIDDTDAERSRPEYEEAIRHDLHWLSIDWDDTFRQSDRLDLYAAAAERLKASGRLYPCFESKEELDAKRERRARRGLSPVYDRAMLALTPAQREAAEAGGKQPYWRFRLSDGAAAWDDLIMGHQQVKLRSVSDPVLVRADGTPLYTLTSVVDDIAAGVTHVIRGADHATNTAIQRDLFAALDADPDGIRFAHAPLLLDERGEKLSKRAEAVSLRKLRGDGNEAHALAAYLARIGTSDDPEPVGMAGLIAGFDLARVSHAPPRFDLAQLPGLNRRVLHELSFEAVADRLPQGATEAFWMAVRGNLDTMKEARGWWDVVAGEIVPPVSETEEDRALMRAALEALPPEPWDGQVWPQWIGAVRDATGRKGRALFLPLRLALTGEDHGPELKELLPLIGRGGAAPRIQLAAA